GRLPQVGVHRLDRPHVQSARRRGGDEDARASRELAAEDELLQVATREVAGPLLRSGGLDAVAADQVERPLADGTPQDEGPAGDVPAAVGLEHRVLADAEARGDARLEPVLGNVADAG